MLDTTQQVPRGALVDIIIAVNYMQYSTQKRTRYGICQFAFGLQNIDIYCSMAYDRRLAFLQVGNYALFFVYLYGDIFGVKEQFPEDLVSYIVMVSVALSVISMMAYAAIYGIINLRHWIRRKRRARKRRF